MFTGGCLSVSKPIRNLLIVLFLSANRSVTVVNSPTPITDKVQHSYLLSASIELIINYSRFILK